MRLLRIRLRHFRGVHDREVSFAEHGVTVLQGENEVGKTTTVQALDMLVDVRDSSRRADVKQAAPAGVDAGPEVEAEITSGPYRFVYRKRWVRRPLTELRILAPAAEQLTGADAHARVGAILDETMDRDLWQALRVDQHAPVGQADLGGLAPLARALDRAAGAGGAAGASSGDGPADGHGDREAGIVEAGIVEAAEDELRRYRTTTGRTTGELRAAEERLDAARTEHERCRSAIAAVEQDVALRDRLDAELHTLGQRHEEHRARVAELEDAWGALQSRLHDVEAARERATVSGERAAVAADRRRARATLIAEVESTAGELTRADTRLAEHERRHAAIREERAARHAEHREAREAAVDAARAARAADDALTLARDRAELADLEAVLRRIAAAEAGLHDADRELAAVTVDHGTVDELDELSRDVVRAEAARDAGAASVEILVADDAAAPEVLLDGDPTALAPGETRRLPVHAPISVSVPGRVEVRVRPGLDGHGLADAVRRATDALGTACAAAGVADLPAARTALRRADDARRRHAEHRATLDRELTGRAVGSVRAARDALRTRVGTLTTDATTDPATTDPAVLRATADEARAVGDAAVARVEETERLRTLADEAVGAADTEAAVLAQRAADARHGHERRDAELTDARAAAPDADLDGDADHHAVRAREARIAYEALAAALAATDPDTLEAQVVNARDVDRRLADDADDAARQRSETTGRLQSAGAQGWHDQLLAASVELAAATHDHEATERRARAAARLHGALVHHRDAVRRAYVAPFRTQVERLARIVFGPGLSLEVDPTLRITHRTLDGVTVPFDELSSGAKEQLALCARLACAALVDPAEGVPVVIDDALGYTDPERLARLGAVFTAATNGGGAQQVLVLTCTPERYRGVGAATVVSLAPSRPPAHDVAGPDVAVVAAHRVARDVGEDPPGHRLPETG